MFWKKKKRKEVEEPKDSPPDQNNQTFKSKVDEFWQWFSTVSDSFYETIEAGKCGDLQVETSLHVHQIWESLAWVYGPGDEEKGGHSLTVSGEGIKAKQFLTEYWKARSPELANWTFYSSRQPGEMGPGMRLQIEGAEFDFGGLWVTPEQDEEREIVHITAWHPTFAEVSEKQKDFALFILLDEILGEYGTDQWLGEIKTGNEDLSGAIPALELREYLHDLEIEKHWRKGSPTECYSNYTRQEPDDRFLRSDTFVGTTRFFGIVADYLENEGPLNEDPFEGSGAEAVFISYPSNIAPQGDESGFRGKIEDRLEAILEENHSGIILGGALGLNCSYIDLIIFDGENSLNLIKSFLVNEELPQGTSIQFFAAGNEGRRVFL